jgi:hypothetical protein
MQMPNVRQGVKGALRQDAARRGVAGDGNGVAADTLHLAQRHERVVTIRLHAERGHAQVTGVEEQIVDVAELGAGLDADDGELLELIGLHGALPRLRRRRRTVLDARVSQFRMTSLGAASHPPFGRSRYTAGVAARPAAARRS